MPHEDLVPPAPETRSQSLLRLIKAPDVVTLAGLTAALFSMAASVRHAFGVAAVLMLAATACDFLDGKLARALGQGDRAFGAALDTVCDAVAFGAAPAVFALCLGLDSPAGTVILAVFLAAAVLRLARFQVSAWSKSHFTGMPVPYNNIALAGAYWVISLGGWEAQAEPVLGALLLALAALMVSTLRWPKF